MTATGLRRALLGGFVLGLGFSITLSQSALAALAVLWLWRLRDPAVRARQTWPLRGPVLAFAGVTLLSAALSDHPAASLLASKGLLLALALYVTVDALTDAREADRFLSALALVGGAAALIGLIQVAACPAPAGAGATLARFFHRCDRARGFFSIYMTLAGVLTLLLLATAPRVLPAGAVRWGAAPPWLLMVLGLAATYVRGAWLGFVAGMLALVPMVRRGRVPLIVGLAALVVLSLAGPQQLRHRIRSMTDPEEPTIKERLYMWRSGVAMWGEHPVLGLGPGGVKRAYPSFALPEAIKKRTSHVHSTPLQILVERGALGFAAWLWIWVAFFVRAGGVLRRLDPRQLRERALVLGSLAAVTGFLVAGLSEYNFGDSEVALVVWALMALPFAAARPGPDTPGGAR